MATKRKPLKGKQIPLISPKMMRYSNKAMIAPEDKAQEHEDERNGDGDSVARDNAEHGAVVEPRREKGDV